MRDDPPNPARLLVVGLLGVAFLAGCQGTSRRLAGRPVAADPEPPLKADIQPGVTVVEPGDAVATATPSATRMAGLVDRHPLLRKPKQYYDQTDKNKAVKVAAATVVGVPAGIVGELKQIVGGRPSAEASTTPATTVY